MDARSWPEALAGFNRYHRFMTIDGQHIHFIGIGGCGMAGLARMTQRLGATVTGSDIAESPTVGSLRDARIDVTLDQTGKQFPGGCGRVVASAAIPLDHPEMVAAQERRIPVVRYAQMLGQLMASHTGVGIAGTHGKSTTTSMLAHILIQAGLDPSFIIGANCKQIGGGSRTSESLTPASPLLAEACEFARSFHHLHPTHAAILNVEADHLDTYSGLDEIVEAFAIYAQKLPAHGSLLIQHELAQRTLIEAGLDCDVQTIGFSPQADFYISLGDQSPAKAFGHDRASPPEVSHDTMDAGSSPKALARIPGQGSTVSINHNQQTVCSFTAPLPGEHMAYNAAVASVLAHRLGAEWDAIANAIAGFQGLDRRMQTVGTFAVSQDFVTVIDDYGHHPTEIDTTLRALRQHHRPERLICVFQPHQHSRTRFLMEQFAASFSQADLVIVPDIYFVRDSEEEKQRVSADDLVQRLRETKVDAQHIASFDDIAQQLKKDAKPGDLIVTMGAGDVWKIGRALIN